jgi:hypothetical protein
METDVKRPAGDGNGYQMRVQYSMDQLLQELVLQCRHAGIACTPTVQGDSLLFSCSAAEMETISRIAVQILPKLRTVQTVFHYKDGKLVGGRVKTTVRAGTPQRDNDACVRCGGAMIGNGYTTARHCENVELPTDREPDADPLYCQPSTGDTAPMCRRLRGQADETHP